jgi:Fic family protein
MEPLLIRGDALLSELAIQLIRDSAALGSQLPAVTRRRVAGVLRHMNSYYSNLIEGHGTHPIDIDNALKNQYAADPKKRALQLESKAHVEVQILIERRLAEEPELNVCSPEFLRWAHREFYERVPEEFRRIRYSPDRLGDVDRVVAAAASHHRLAWIHPFLDGNGRVTRLFTDAYLARAGVGGQGLWTTARGLARRREDYFVMLTNADAPRENDFDGRGNLSARGLAQFIKFFLETAIDQVHFMSSLLDLEALERRILSYAERESTRSGLHPRSGALLSELLRRGEVARGDVAGIVGLGGRAARSIVQDLQQRELVVSETPKGALSLGFPARAVGYYFPRLYPEAVEVDLG